MHRKIAIRCVERSALAVLRVEGREVEEMVAIDIGRGEEDLPELHEHLEGNPRKQGSEVRVQYDENPLIDL